MIPLSDKFRDRVDSLFKSQQNRAREKKDKNGRILKKGYLLPFDKKQFVAWLLDKFGGTENGVIQCRYCHRAIDVYACQIDHAVPLKRSGSPALSNLDVPCAPCNAIKGPMTPEEMEYFCGLMIDMGNHFHNGVAVQSITHRLESYSKMKATVNAGRARKNAARVAAVVAGIDEDW